MALSEKIVGMHYRYPDHYVVGREKLREYATAVKNDDAAYYDEAAAAELGHGSLCAPLTFISVFGYQAQSAFFASADIGITDMKIIQVDQVLKFAQADSRRRQAVLRRVHGLDPAVPWRRHHRDQEHHYQ